MRYSEDVIEEVRSKTDIVELISGYVKLQRRGSSYFGLCPFHNEKSPSFSVSPGKQMYYCFGCGAGGNVFTFLMEYENYSFQEALKLLAERAGVKLPELSYSREARELADRKALLLEINKQAAKYYYCKLRSPAGERAMGYLRGRGLSGETIQKFGLGYSDRYSSDLYRYLKSKNYTDQVLMETGLFNMDEKKGIYDKFWNRVIFPIMDANSRVIGLGGGVLGDLKQKYLNSPETKIFDKSRNLSGLHAARSSRKKNLIICEGYMDVISMHQAGFTNAVASLGTALTSQQASLLKRYTGEVLVIYDSDEAGIKAALRAVPMLRGAGLTTKVVNLRPHKDPDEFIQEEGMEAFEERLEQAENGFLYEIRMLQRNYDMNDPQGKSDFFHETAGRLLQFEDEIERNSYLEAVARAYHTEAKVLQKLVNRLALRGAGQETSKPRPARTEAPGQKRTEKEDGIRKAQKLMLTWMTSYPEILDGLSGYITSRDFVTPFYRKVAEMVEEQHRQGQVNPARIISRFEDGEEQSLAASLFNTKLVLESDTEKRTALKDVICNMKESSLNYRLSHLSPEDLGGLQALMTEKKKLEALRAGPLPEELLPS